MAPLTHPLAHTGSPFFLQNAKKKMNRTPEEKAARKAKKAAKLAAAANTKLTTDLTMAGAGGAKKKAKRKLEVGDEGPPSKKKAIPTSSMPRNSSSSDLENAASKVNAASVDAGSVCTSKAEANAAANQSPAQVIHNGCGGGAWVHCVVLCCVVLCPRARGCGCAGGGVSARRCAGYTEHCVSGASVDAHLRTDPARTYTVPPGTQYHDEG